MTGFNLCPRAAATDWHGGAEVYNLLDGETDVRHAASFQPVGRSESTVFPLALTVGSAYNVCSGFSGW